MPPATGGGPQRSTGDQIGPLYRLWMKPRLRCFEWPPASHKNGRGFRPSKKSEKQVRRTPKRWDMRMNPPARLTSHAHQQCSDTFCRRSDHEKSTILVTGSCISTVLFLLV